MRPLNPARTWLLGVVVVLLLGVGGFGLFHLASRQHRFRGGEPLYVVVNEASDVQVGTPVRLRGIEAGQVSQVDYTADGVLLELQLDPKLRPLLYADATATVKPKGIFGSSVVDIVPGSPNAGPLQTTQLQPKMAPDLTDVTTKLNSIATRMDAILVDVQEGKGTLPKLLKDDSIYLDLKEVTADTKKLVKNVDQSVTAMRTDAQKTMTKIDSSVTAIHTEMDGVRTFVRNGQEAVTALKQNAEAIKAMPIVRSYVEDTTAILIRPDCNKERYVWSPDTLFEPNTSTLSDHGRQKLNEAADWFNSQKQANSEVVVVAFVDPKSTEVSPAAAKTLAKKQAETITEYLKNRGVHKMGYISRRKVTPLGMGMEPTPVTEKEVLSPARIELILFVPR